MNDKRSLAEIPGCRLIDERTADGTREFRLRLDTGARWFEGHFPGDPVLPAIAQLNLIDRLLRREPGQAVAIAGFDNLRFVEAARPGDELLIRIAAPVGESAQSFEILRGATRIATGRIVRGGAR